MENRPHSKQIHTGRDWFYPAVAKDGSVSSSLAAVEKDLQKKLHFMQSLQDNLCKLSQSDFDAVTDLWNRTRILKTTLEVRLGVLNEERPGGWFREAIYDSAGPFQAKTLKEPVFTQYETSKYPRIREQIQKCWRSGMPLDSTLQKPGDSLWRRLMDYNARFQKIATIRVNQHFELNLNRVPHNIPEDLDSPLIRQFLLNVAAQLSRLRTELNECYTLLWKSSTALWRQQMDHFQNQADRATDERRQNFSERRKQKYAMSSKDMAQFRALRFMGFEAMPEPNELRSRYLMLAKKFHPDLLGGSEENFKRLSESYRILSEKK